MSERNLDAFINDIGAELQALRIGLFTLTGFVALAHPPGTLADIFEQACDEIEQREDAPPRTIEYLREMARISRRTDEEGVTPAPSD